jgi:hypothetical protein
VDDEVEGILKEVAVICFEILFLHLPGCVEENHGKPSVRIDVIPFKSRIRSPNKNKSVALPLKPTYSFPDCINIYMCKF